MDSESLEILRADLEKAGWPFEELLDHGQAAPQWWAKLPAGEAIQRLRRIAGLTQSELGLRAGVGQSHVARVEAGQDCRLSTLWRLYSAMGYQAVLLPVLDGSNPRLDPRKPISPDIQARG